LATRYLNVLATILEFTHLNVQTKVREFESQLNALNLDSTLEIDEIRMIMLYTIDSPDPPFFQIIKYRIKKGRPRRIKTIFPVAEIITISIK